MSTQEKKLVSSIAKLQRNWPKGFWLFANGVRLYLMKTHPDGTRHDPQTKGMDASLIVATFSIPSDGGDW